ncbi:MAG: EamA family transporter, partial [Acidobacteriales bacterium]|nr:EamA family transporter [Terriglobales bacterium]
MPLSPRFKAYTAFAAVCFFWGTTYLTIRMSLEAFPPLIVVGARFTLAGLITLAGARLARARLPRGRELWQCIVNGMLILGVGNGALVYSEVWVPSGMAALMLTISPFWMVGLDAFVFKGTKLRLMTVVGMLVGLSGVLLLIGPDALDVRTGASMVAGFLVLQAGSVCWNVGSLLQRRQPTLVHPIVSAGVQQLAVGMAALAVAAIVPGQVVHWSARGAGALLYLVVFGSLVGYSAYLYALDSLPVPVLSLYTYVNPVVAVILGWIFYREPFTLSDALAVPLIFSGIA